MSLSRIDFVVVARVALAQIESLLGRWLPDGRRAGHEFQALNPRRNDRSVGSFSVNLTTGAWGDFADNAAGELLGFT